MRLTKNGDRYSMPALLKPVGLVTTTTMTTDSAIDVTSMSKSTSTLKPTSATATAAITTFGRNAATTTNITNNTTTNTSTVTDVTAQPLDLLTSSALLATPRLTSTSTFEQMICSSGKRRKEAHPDDVSWSRLEPAPFPVDNTAGNCVAVSSYTAGVRKCNCDAYTARCSSTSGERTCRVGIRHCMGVSCCSSGMDFPRDSSGGGGKSIYVSGVSNTDSDTIYTGSVSNNTDSSVHRTSSVDVSNSGGSSIYMGSISSTTTATDSDIYTGSVGFDSKEDIYTDRENSRHVQHSVYDDCLSNRKPLYQHYKTNTFVRHTDQSAITQQHQQYKCRQSEVPKPHRQNTHTHHARALLKTSYSMNTLPTLSIFCLLLLNLAGSTYASICPKVCFCQAAMNHVGCSKKNFTEIPDLIPSDTKQLSLNGNLFSNKVLVRKNFSRLSNLEDLFLNECGIEVITLDTFADLRHLCMLDLSNNKLRFIEDYTFRGLSLNHLLLNSNPGIQFAPKAFTGFRTIGLHLKKCGLHNLSLEEIRPLNGTVNIIWLNNNNFRYLSEEWYYLLKNFEHVRLEDNPMHCNCELAWLYRMFINNSNLFPKDKLMSCASPRRLNSKTFDMLTLDDFQCQLPIFEGVDVLVGPHVGKLSCRARADPSPTLYWHKPGGLTETFHPSKDRAVKINRAVLYIHNHHSSISSHYRCVANNPAGNVTFNLQVTWPQRESENKIYITTLPTESSLPKSHSRSSNQTMNMGDLTVDVLFTLMELIGAVIGTFLLTFLLCLLIFHFFGRQPRPMGPQEKEHSEKRRTPENHYVMADIDESSIKMMEHKDLVS
ncbi:uncharacterized protein LOC115231150 [Octopus sinensis]|uniref:Uncharacterized protein LOC115231150 n=1 Tax=Octopus sinensis TaxID=2607531 RepID=A0A6P7U7W0_9MOLL|nr:uncharacterized protein LOC115231150 [Octopus sinensis]